MSTIDQSLDEIMKDAKSTNPKRGRGRRANGPKTTAAPPVGGVGKNTKAPRPAKGNNSNTNKPAAPAARVSGESKILVSGLPDDITEQQLKVR